MTRSLAALLFALLLPLSVAATPATAPVAGEDYVLIDGGQPYQPLAGKIEIAEVFAYWCSHCADFQPQVDAWTRKLPADVRFSYVPAVFSDGDPYARAYFAAEDARALTRTHAATFRAIHDDKTLAMNATVDEIAWFYGQHGLDAAKTKTAMTSAATEAKLQRAHDFALRSGVEGTPTLIVNGRYRVQGRTHEDALRIAGQLIAQLRAARR
ncbi:MAG TPA: thiol:disulfide interchange protein DsbA/DsbL [Luteimonas sp.]|nr:thiol:disulfide interchange protein DsbA/DsbL [Luteimonas sp.]